MVELLALTQTPYSFTHRREFAKLKVNSLAPSWSDISDCIRSLDATDRRGMTAGILHQRALLILQRLQMLPHIRFIDYWHPLYPPLLKNLEDPPWGIFVEGKLPHEVINPGAGSLAVVGSRNPNIYGLRVVHEILSTLAPERLIIVSGLASGIDSAAHECACRRGIVNFAVLGNGIGSVFPYSSRPLANRIIAGGGGIISEFPPGEPPQKSHFPRRNRIISGLCQSVWIVQGTLKSGSRHTAVAAVKQGRQILATPGDIFSELSLLPLELIRDGAQPINDHKDLSTALDRTVEAKSF